MKKFFATYLLLCAARLFGQVSPVELQGTVTFITSQSIYVKFEVTEQIPLGDTLLWNNGTGWIPCLLVKNKSSVSVVCVPLNGCAIVKDAQVIYRSGPVLANIQKNEDTPPVKKEIVKKERIHGRISAASFSNISEQAAPSHRMMYRLNLNADRIGESKFSAETFLNFRQLYLPPEKSDIQRTKYFSVYNLALRYQPDSTSSITVGRKINNKASSLGAIDGLQAEKYFGRVFTGLIVGFRPDFVNYSVNFNLLEYGAYAGLESNRSNLNSKTTLGLLQQTNSGAVDRRYLYFQHSSTIRNKLTLFTSSELDLFNEVNGKSLAAYRLTNFFTSASYRFSRAVDLNLSYDSRKQIMYYETYSSDIERMLDDDQARQGVRARLGVKPAKYASIGVSYAKRFQSSNQNPSDNINGYITYTKLPATGGRISLNYNRNRSNYLLSEIISVRLSHDLFNKKVNFDVYVRNARYTYFSDIRSSTYSEQYYYGISLMHRITSTLSYSLLGEMSTRQDVDNYRVNIRLNKRIDTAKKKKKSAAPEPDNQWRF